MLEEYANLVVDAYVLLFISLWLFTTYDGFMSTHDVVVRTILTFITMVHILISRSVKHIYSKWIRRSGSTQASQLKKGFRRGEFPDIPYFPREYAI